LTAIFSDSDGAGWNFEASRAGNGKDLRRRFCLISGLTSLSMKPGMPDGTELSTAGEPSSSSPSSAARIPDESQKTVAAKVRIATV
jgi:hypothetical protein